MKEVSAVLFVYNEEKYIKIQLDSVLNQSIPPKKIIIVDDQSTDGTKEVIIPYIEEYDNISYHYNPNKGKVNAYALGLSLVDTEFFFVCHGDDKLKPNLVEYQLNYLEENNIDFAYARFI